MQTSDIVVETVTCSEELHALEREWNVLLQSTPSDTLFLTWEWISTWWLLYGTNAKLHVLTARDRSRRLIGLAPLKLVRRRALGMWPLDTIEFIGAGGDVTPEYLDFIADPSREGEVVDAFVTHLRRDPGVDIVDLRPLAEHSPHIRRLEAGLGNGRGSMLRLPESACPVLTLPQTIDEFMAKRSPNYRKKIREYEGRCDRRLAAQLRVSATIEEIQRDMAALVKLHSKRWRGRSRAFQSKRYVEFHQRLAPLLLERGWLRLHTLEAVGNRIAALYCFSYRGRYYYYQAGRDPKYDGYRVGLVLMHKVIKEAIVERALAFDFLRGLEAYKYRWATTTARNIRLVFWKSPLLRAGSFLWETGQFVRQTLPGRPQQASLCPRAASTQ